MLAHYFKIAFRNMTHNKMGALINISGLTVGMTSILLISLYIGNELKYDRFHKDANRIFQVTLDIRMDGEEDKSGNTPPPTGSALFRSFPEIESYTRFYKPGDLVMRSAPENGNERYFTEAQVLAVDSNFLELFDFPLLAGDPSNALEHPGSIVITREMAKKYFGREDVLGKVLRMNENNKPFTVTAILDNVPSQSTIQFDFLTPIADFPAVKRFSWSWVWRQMITYVKLKPTIPTDKGSLKSLEAKFPAMLKIQAAPGFARLGKPFEEFIKNGGKFDLHLLPLTKGHLYSGEIGMPWLYHVSNIKYVYIFSCIACFIIILASVNFMNLSTAKSGKRAKEVGIRKVSGSTRAQLIRQFLAEAFLYCLVSAVLAFLLALVLIKPFSLMAGEGLDTASLFSGIYILSFAALIILVTLLAGIYPAFYLTSFSPISVLKGTLFASSGKSALYLRNSLVVFQFCVSTILIICTFIVFRQLNYFKTADMGINKDNVMVISNSNRLGQSEESFRQEISQIPGISTASISTSLPTGFLFGDSYQPIATAGEKIPTDLTLTSFIVDEYFVPTLQLHMLKGRNFSKEFTDTGSVILNEEAIKQIGWKNPLGRYLRYPGGRNELYKVIGIVRDFNVESLRAPIVPFALFHTSSKSYDLGTTLMLVRMRPGQTQETVSAIEKTWKSFGPGKPFDYNFLDARFDSQYRAEQRMGKIFSVFTVFSIFIACLGLFGLSAYIAERRIKEIGIRKVLGASSYGLVKMLSMDFLKLTLIASLIAFPVAWWSMHQWLEDFPYRIQIGWTVFLAGGMVTLLIAMLTISFQAIKASNANPVKSLRAE